MKSPVPVDAFTTFFFDDSHDLFVAFDNQGRILSANNSLKSVSGFDETATGTLSIYTLLHEHDHKDFSIQMGTCLSRQHGVTFTLQLRTGKNELLWCSCYLRYHTQTSLFYALLQNITD